MSAAGLIVRCTAAGALGLGLAVLGLTSAAAEPCIVDEVEVPCPVDESPSPDPEPEPTQEPPPPPPPPPAEQAPSQQYYYEEETPEVAPPPPPPVVSTPTPTPTPTRSASPAPAGWHAPLYTDEVEADSNWIAVTALAGSVSLGVGLTGFVMVRDALQRRRRKRPAPTALMLNPADDSRSLLPATAPDLTEFDRTLLGAPESPLETTRPRRKVKAAEVDDVTTTRVSGWSLGSRDPQR